MNCCALLFLLLILGSGNCGSVRTNCGCNTRIPDRNKTCGCNYNREREDNCGCDYNREREENCGCNHNHDHEETCGCDTSGIIPPPWVRVDGGRDNDSSCGCNRH